MMDVLREVLLPKLERVRKQGGYWMASCPAHEDRQASLSVAAGKEHPVVLNCKAGCDSRDILAKLGLTWDTLCEPREESRPRGEWTPHGEATAVYDYTDEDGNLLFQVLRTPGKQFPQRVPDRSRKTGWRWSLGETRRVLYRLPKVLEAINSGETIWITEGEKDVQALEGAGVTATCNPGGAGKWRPEFAEIFRDVIVVVVADKDKPGQAHARQVAASLEGVAAAVEIVEAGAGKDAADHLAAGKSTGEFVVTKDAGVVAEPELAPDLHEFLTGIDPPEDWVIRDLLEREDRLIWTGEEGRGKSVAVRELAIAAAAGIQPFTDVIGKPMRVLFIDCENSVRKSRRHFRRLEYIAREAKRCPIPPGGFRLIHRLDINLGSEEEAAWLIERVTAHKPDLLVIGPLYKLHALDINEEQAARAITRVLDEARARTEGAALIVEAHAPHGPDGARVMRPFGSSLFLRWPEFGYGIRMAKGTAEQPATKRRVDVIPWRGPRDERKWPKQLTWGTDGVDWPWVVPTDRNFSVVDGEAG
jgi:hypothetical protein